MDALSSLSRRITSTTLSKNLVGLSSPEEPTPRIFLPKQHVIDRISPKAPNPSLSPKSVCAYSLYLPLWGREGFEGRTGVSRAPRRHQGREAAYQFEAAIVRSPSPITAPVTFPLGRCANRTRTRSSRVHSTIPKMQQGSLPALFPGVRSPSIPELHDFVHLRGFHVALQRKERKKTSLSFR